MRIRTYRSSDTLALAHIRQLAAQADSTEARSGADFEAWLSEPALEAEFNVFVVTDDDSESNQWGQSETLEGIEGEIVGYTVLQLQQRPQSYHFRCEGAVLPQQRRRNAGRSLLICALNRARIWASEFELEAEQEGVPIYFEALLPLSDPVAARLAAKCEMTATEEAVAGGMRLYRREEL
ncbi:MAG: GNAT family N-acetyltransferase [Chloroflexota bacterium]|nr:GNAT family N-acetyltransferase [Chloroflexota bacterium]